MAALIDLAGDVGTSLLAGSDDEDDVGDVDAEAAVSRDDPPNAESDECNALS